MEQQLYDQLEKTASAQYFIATELLNLEELNYKLSELETYLSDMAIRLSLG